MAAARFLDSHRGALQAFMVIGPLLIGAYPLTGLINPVWGSLFGFPLYAAAQGHPVYGQHPWTEFAAFFVWPLVIIAVMTWVSGVIVRMDNRWRAPVISLWCLSALAVVPFQQVSILFPGWPVYCACE